MEWLLKPLIMIVDWLIKRDLERWARTPLLFDTNINQEATRILEILADDFSNWHKKVCPRLSECALPPSPDIFSPPAGEAAISEQRSC